MTSYRFVYDIESANEPIVLHRPSSEYPTKSKTQKDKNTPTKKIDVFEACCKGRIDVIKNYISTFGSGGHHLINKKDKDDFSLLHYAVRFNHYLIVKYLISHRADVNITGGPDKTTPLHLAARYKATSISYSKRNLSSESLDVILASASSPSHKGSRFKIKDLKGSKLFKTSIERSFDSQGVLISAASGKKQKSSRRSSTHLGTLDTIISALVSGGCDLNSRDKNDATPLHYAAMARNVSAFEELMSYPVVNIECKDSNWMTPLHYSAEQGCVPIAQMLLDKGASLETLNKFDMTPLHYACEEGHPDVAELLIHTVKRLYPDRLSYFVNLYDRNNHTSLHYASMSGNQQLVSLLLENTAECIVSNLCGNMTPLHYACAAGNVDIVRILVEREPNLVNEKNSHLETPLHIASSLNRFDIVKYLLTQNAEVDSLDRDNESPLYIASKKDHDQIVKLLHAQNASVYSKNNEDYTPFHIAAYSNSLKTLKYFLSLDEYPNLQNIWDSHEHRPIHLAVLSNNVDVVKFLIDYDAPVEAKNDRGLTPLLLAASKGYIEILKILLNFSAPLALDEDDVNNTALHLAAENGYYKAVPILVNSGVPVDNVNTSQLTALDLACAKGHVKTVSALLDAEASINTHESTKFTSPLLISSKNGHPEVVSLLISRGADVSRLDASGRNCLEIAIDENRKEAVLAIINSPEWECSLRHVSSSNGVYYSPLRRLIDTMPDVAEIVLDKCITNNSLPKNHPKYQIFCNYEYLEDMHTGWGASLRDFTSTIRWKYDTFVSKLYYNALNAFRKLRYKAQNRNHPLSLIVEKNRTSLLRHPLVRYLVRNKWNVFSFYIYYFRVCLMLLTLIFLTGLCVTSASPPYPCIRNFSQPIPTKPLDSSYFDDLDGCISCPMIYYPSSVPNVIFITFGRFAVLMLALVHITTGLLSLGFNLRYFFNIQSILELIGSILMIVFVSGFFSLNGRPIELISLFRCRNAFRSIGALAVCLMWISFVLFLSKLPKIGIYVVMYMDIFRTFVQFMPVYFMLIMSFSIPFYMLFLDRYDTNSYVTIFKATMKTLVSTVGEIEYDTFYNTKDEPPLDITYLILFLFILSNSIILMNLLVGLAVDDIQGVQSKAFLKRLGLQILMTMEFESVLPDHILKKYINLEETIQPNDAKHQWFWSLWEFKSNPFTDDKNIGDPTERFDTSFRDLNNNMRALKSQLKVMSEKYSKLEGLLEEILNRTQNKL